MNNMSFEQIQENLRGWMGDSIKSNSKKANMIEQTYIRALHDAKVAVPTICDILVMSGRSIVNYGK